MEKETNQEIYATVEFYNKMHRGEKIELFLQIQ